MTWEEFCKDKSTIPPNLQRTDIDCPECGEKIYVDTSVVLACYPPKLRYECQNCGWGGMA